MATGLVSTVATTHAQNATSDVGGTFQQVQTAANAWIPAIMAAATRLFPRYRREKPTELTD
ncbi:MAG: hypothetical protein ABR905_05315 [Terracidiphilus sp.]